MDKRELFGAGERLTNEVIRWEGVTLNQHRFGGTEFRFDRWAFGHVHGNELVDILLPKTVRDDLVNQGLAEPHHVLPTTGWVTIYLTRPKDEEKAVQVLRVAYDRVRERVRSAPLPFSI